MSVAMLYPARVGADGRAWWRPVRPAGCDLSQWGWTSQASLAHPDYGHGPHVLVHTPTRTAVLCGGPGACVACDEDADCNGLHREGTCGGDCSGCVGDGEGGPTAREAIALRMAALDDARRALESTGLLW